MNPLSQDLGVMRQTLLFGGLECISHNINRQMPNLRLFEYGNCYYYDESRKVDLDGQLSNAENSKQVLAPYSEDFHLGLWVTGKRISGSWAHADETLDVYQLKAYVENILSRLGVPFGALVFGEESNDIFAKSVKITNRGGKLIAQYGIVSKKQTSKFDIDQQVCYADINWSNLYKAIKGKTVSFYEIPKYPAVSRDLALLLDKSVEFQQIADIAQQTEKKLLKAVKLFDVYEGKNLEEGKKSYAVNFLLQDETKTLNDKQIEQIMNKIENNLVQKLGAKVRGK